MWVPYQPRAELTLQLSLVSNFLEGLLTRFLEPSYWFPLLTPLALKDWKGYVNTFCVRTHTNTGALRSLLMMSCV